jgi:histidinol phosphatase-like enzyme
MKKVFQLFLYNIVIILTFTIIYYMIGDKHFENLKGQKKVTALDCLFLATTIQSGVGLADINLTTSLAKTIAILQQLSMLGNTIFMIYLFSL